jgi:hypothetical protein
VVLQHAHTSTQPTAPALISKFRWIHAGDSTWHKIRGGKIYVISCKFTSCLSNRSLSFFFKSTVKLGFHILLTNGSKTLWKCDSDYLNRGGQRGHNFMFIKITVRHLKSQRLGISYYLQQTLKLLHFQIFIWKSIMEGKSVDLFFRILWKPVYLLWFSEKCGKV